MAQAKYLRDTSGGLLSMRRAITRDAKWDVYEAAQRAAALALDFIQNNGWIAGAAQQVLCDTVGEELRLNCRAQLQSLGWSAEDESAWCRETETAWRQWAYDARECDLAGKMTVPEMTDAALRSYLATGEALGVVDRLGVRQRRALGVQTGVKVSLVPSHRLPRVTQEMVGMDGGIFHDAYGRARVYRFRLREDGIERDRDIPAANVIHVMDRGEHLGSPRGITPMAPALKAAAQGDQLADATLAVALMQQAFAAVIKSPEPSDAAFEALQTLSGLDAPEGVDSETWGDLVGGIQADLVEAWGARIDAMKKGSLSMTDPARIAHLGPGEEFQMVTAHASANNYVAHWQNLAREIARCIGVTYESFTGDHSNATYSSVRMAGSSIWPVVLRRRARIAAPFVQGIYERWLDESIAEGRIGFRGGYAAFAANREKVFQAEFQGPSQPTADDYKSAMAVKVRLETYQSSIEDELAAAGKNPSETLAQIAREKAWLESNELSVPFGRSVGGAGPMGAAADGNREPAREDA
ncbi:phage portal protein [Xanthobacter sp. TB0136]|uniref:phage portal protein n=1 Tax=Xanthobacter sp. TB0136 TaxID=3459177 RepID=UPI00403A1F92